MSEELRAYGTRRFELTTEAGVLLWGRSVIVPPKFQTSVLKQLHETHQGVVRMKSLTRLHTWWPQIDKVIEGLSKECVTCQRVGKNPPKVELQPWSWPSKPFQRIHIDFAGPMAGKMFLIVVDAYSKWVEVCPMSSTTSERTINEL